MKRDPMEEYNRELDLIFQQMADLAASDKVQELLSQLRERQGHRRRTSRKHDRPSERLQWSTAKQRAKPIYGLTKFFGAPLKRNHSMNDLI